MSVSEAQSPLAQHLPKDKVLLPEVFDSVLLVPVQPSCKGQDQELDRERERFHDRHILLRPRRNLARDRSFESLHPTGSLTPEGLGGKIPP